MLTTPSPRKVLKVPSYLKDIVPGDSSDKTMSSPARRKPPNLIIKLKNERFLVSQNKIEVINNNEPNNNGSGDKEDKSKQDNASSDRALIINCDTDNLDEIQKEAFDLLSDYLSSNPDLHNLLAANGLLDNVNSSAKVDQDSGDLDFDFSFSDIPLNTRPDTLESEVFKGLGVFDNIDEIEASFVEEICEPAAKEDNPRSFTSHYYTSHDRKSSLGVRNQKVLYDCKVCAKVFITWFELHDHEAVHDTRDLVCEICEKSFRKESYLTTHMDIHRCTKCGDIRKLNAKQLCGKCEKKESQRRADLRKKEAKINKDIYRWRVNQALTLNKVLLRSRQFQ